MFNNISWQIGQDDAVVFKGLFWLENVLLEKDKIGREKVNEMQTEFIKWCIEAFLNHQDCGKFKTFETLERRFSEGCSSPYGILCKFDKGISCMDLLLPPDG